MTRHDIDPTIMDWLFAREVCRRLGFTPDEIFFACYPSGCIQDGNKVIQCDGPIVGLELRRGDLEFRWTIGVCKLAADRVHPEYERAVALWNSDAIGFSHGDFLSSRPARMSMQLMVALTDKGFSFRTPARHEGP